MDEFDGEGAWAWERLVAHNESLLDAAWAELMQQQWRATEVPLERRGTVLDVGINSWARTARPNTSKLAVIFNRGLGVCLVCKNFLAYRDAFLYGLGFVWGIEVPNVELSQPQSEAAFEVCASLQELERRAGQGAHSAAGDNSCGEAEPSGTQPACSPGHNDEHSDRASNKVKWNVLTVSAARSMRRRPGATKWTIKLCRALVQELKGHVAEGEAGPSTLARKVWKIVLDCDVTGANELKDRARERWRKERKRERNDNAGRNANGAERVSDETSALTTAGPRPPVAPAAAFRAPRHPRRGDHHERERSTQRAPRAGRETTSRGAKKEKSGGARDPPPTPSSPCWVAAGTSNASDQGPGKTAHTRQSPNATTATRHTGTSTWTSGATSKTRAPSDSRIASCPWQRPSNASGGQCGTAGAPGTTPVSCVVSTNPH